ncbi:histidine kinase dimerization/phosphoacceptor domain -containing protein [Flavitalea sp. BT771]|uniref:tetratricopeptide repeat-containing sensor histidine kinase n=1 Tax=Flavitalea sp. BT771 TaxID=3063329 RepID=UPI0026E42263|nr:histidine kinase dimerization/phosphoacceptor domain -containing protein [Flavitalea sp. BT771]MDO6431136.1 histidine kinase dimerization/phosphoacceptor domain -containing protein [Flavitalea sp. BT771]MDV6220043.1 histidine kinase dimerization/phosphoacceptor domain -containing protein [Flavitalea sp. BT771]
MMLKSITYLFFLIITVVPGSGQQLSPRPRGQLLLLLQESKQDSNRISILDELGRTYLKQMMFGDKKMYLRDTAIDIFNHAIRLSDTLQLKQFRYESMSLVGEAYLARGDTAEGKKIFSEVASLYHTMGDVQEEAGTWLRLAQRMNKQLNSFAGIDTFFNKAITLYKQARNIEKEAEARTHLADYLFKSGRSNLAEKELLQALDLLHQKGSTRLFNAYFLLSAINRYRGSYEKSLLYAVKCVENVERNKDIVRTDTYYGELALVYDELGRAEESSQWYRKTLEKRMEQRVNRVFILRTAGFLIRQLIKLRKCGSALALVDSLVAAYPPQEPFEKAIVAQNYAYCFDGLNQYPEAEKYFLAVAAYYKDAPPENEIISITHMDIGRFYLQHRQFKKAHIYLDTALAYISYGRLLNQRDLFQMLFTADSALGNSSAAIKDLQQYQFLNDSIFNERKSRQIEELTIQYETEKKEQSIRLLEKERRLQQTELTQVQNTRSWILGVAILLIIIVGLLINYSLLKQRTNRKLHVQQKQIEKKNNSLQHLVEEKEWLVREIHHRVKNNFHTVMALLRTQSEYLQGEEAIQAVTESQQRIQAMSLVHQRLYQSDNLSAINMTDYIHELVDCLKDSFHTGHKIQFNLQVDPVKLDVSHCVPLGLILNEAITNSLKHAFPDKKEGAIDISLKRTLPNHFLLSIKDNGVGLPPAFDSKKQPSMGMKLMHGLSGDIDAKFQIKSHDGTEIMVDFICDSGTC